MSALASLEAQFRQHRNAYLAGAAGVVVLLALRARGKSAKSDTPVPSSYTTGNPAGPYDGTLASAAGAPLDLSPIQMQLAGLSQQLADYATLGLPPGGNAGTPSPVTATTPATEGTVITAPAGRLPDTPAVPTTVPGTGSAITGPPTTITPVSAAPAPRSPAPSVSPLAAIDIATLPKRNATTDRSITSIPESQWTARQRAYADMYGLGGKAG